MLVRPRAHPPIAPFLGPSRETWLPWEEIGRGPLRDGPAAATIQLDTFAGGTFSRALEAWYHTGAPTNGLVPYGAWAAPGVRRVDDRGDGLGPMLWMEGGRTNLFRNSEDTSAVWSSVNSTTPAGAMAAPDGDLDADGPFTPTAANGRGQQTLTTFTDGQQAAISGYFLDAAGDPVRFNVIGRDAVSNVSPDKSTSPIWSRADYSVTVGTGVASVLAGFYTGTTQLPIDRVWGLQIEAGQYWPSSYIRTAAAAVARPADVLTYAPGSYPAEFLSQGFTVTYVPDYSSAELLNLSAGTAHYIVGYFSASLGVRIRVNSGSNCTFGLLGNSGNIASTGVAFNRGQPMVLTAKNNNDGTWTLTVAGATTGNGSVTGAVSFSAGGSLTVGSNTSGTGNVFGRISRYIDVAA
jgi:hypothetical protein